MSLRAFLTGASGFVGMNLAQQLAEQGWETTALVRRNSPLEDIRDLGIKLVEGDITDAESVRSAMPRDLDCVFHVAASTNIWSRNNDMQTLVNIDGTQNVLDSAVRSGAKRLIHTSSFIVWGFVDDILTEESTRSDNADWINYVRTKFVSENIVKEAVVDGEIDAVILNPAHILGPGDRHNWSRVVRLVNDDDLPGVPPGGGAFSDVREVARAHIQAYHQGRTGQNYLLGGPDEMFIDIVGMTGDILGKKVPSRATAPILLKAGAQLFALAALITGKEPDLTPEGAALIIPHIQCDSSKAVSELGYRFTPVREQLMETIYWMRGKGMLN